MAAHGRDDDRPFLSRWSQRKRQAEEAAREAEADAAPEAEPDAAPEEIDPAELPDIDSLDAKADFSVFMRKGVPNALKQKALRRLWQVDPAFKHICMLDDYNQDFTDAAMVVPNLKTVYQVGRGMVQVEEELETMASSGDSLAGGAPRADDGRQEPGTMEPPALAPSATASFAGPEDEQRADGAEAAPAAADLADSVGGAENAPARAPLSGGARSARQRRWGDAEG